MLHVSSVRKPINYWLIAAVIVPLLLIAGGAWVEGRHSSNLRQEMAKIRHETEAVWINRQAVYLKAIARICGSQAGNHAAILQDFNTFLDEKAGLAALAYVDLDGRIQVATAEPPGRYVGQREYFTAAADGQLYTGEIPAAEWGLDETVTVVAVPVTVNNEITGVVYGVMRKDAVQAMTTGVIPAGQEADWQLSRWLAWLGAVYLAGIIPVLCMSFSRSRQAACLRPGSDKPELPAVLGDKLSAAVVDKTLAAAVKEQAAGKKSAARSRETPPAKPEALAAAASLPAGLPVADGSGKTAAAGAGQTSPGVIICHIDGIGVINDILGAEAGAAAVKAATGVILSAVGVQPTMARRADCTVVIAGAGTAVLAEYKKDIEFYVDLHNLLQPELPLSITVGFASAAEGDDLPAVWEKARADMERGKAGRQAAAHKFIRWSINRYHPRH